MDVLCLQKKLKPHLTFSVGIRHAYYICFIFLHIKLVTIKGGVTPLQHSVFIDI